MPKNINMMRRTVEEINVEDVGLYAHDRECFELYIYCGIERRASNDVYFRGHKRAYRCLITDRMLQKLLLEIQEKYLGVESGPDESEEKNDD